MVSLSFSLIVLLVVVASALATAPSDNDCGYTAVTPNTESERIVGGTEARPHSWPWQTQIRYYNIHWCGGSVIAQDWVLTAAHCFDGKDPNKMSFRFGRHSRIDTQEPYEQVSTARNIYKHEQYNENGLSNDVALVRLNTPVTYTDQVKAVCLPTRSTSLPAGTSAYLTGWGALKFGGSGPDYLMQVMLPAFDLATCNSTYYKDLLKPGMFCAGYAAGGKDSCKGDSGGPLVSNLDGRWEQYGVVSWGIGCGKRPGVYSDMVYFESWIRNKIAEVESEEEQVSSKRFKPRPFGAVLREELDV